MIIIELNKNDFSYDLQTLTKSFYPGEDIKVLDKAPMIAPEKVIKVLLEDDSIDISFCQNGISILNKRKADLCCQTSRKQYKNHLKQLLYQVLSQVSGYTLPWGTMTGVRPTKIPLDLLLDGYSVNHIEDYLKEHYLCSDEKIKLSILVAKKEISILDNIDYKNGYSLYIGIPFCPTTCLYCSFTSFSLEKNKGLVEKYMEALYKEIEYASTCVKDKKLISVYIGGGTPTTLSAIQLEVLIDKLKKEFSFKDVKEFNVEAGRPDSITLEKLQVLKKKGVTRISINPQTMNQKTLDLIGRNHSVEQVTSAFNMAREVGHDNINMDIIVGLPGETCEDINNTLRCIRDLNPDSFTVHSLVMKRAAMLNIYKENYKNKGLPIGMDEMLARAASFAKEEGYEPYYMYRQKNTTGSSKNGNQENIGYARPGKEGIYNILIMEEKQTILALGAGASTKFFQSKKGEIKRIVNVKNLIDYIERVDEMIQRKVDFLLKDNK